MQKQQLGSSALALSRIGIGTFAMGSEGWKASWGPQDDRASIAAIHAALDAGVNWIDTAPVYGLGHAETIVGRAIRGRPQRPIIATKCGRWGDADTLTSDLSAATIRKECEDSLRRLGVDCIDIYQIHWPLPDEQIEEGWSTVAELARAGKVRYAGVSNFSVAQMRRAQSIFPLTSLQPPYSLVRREIEEEILPFCRQEHIGVIVYSPMCKGLLSGRFTAQRAAALPESDHRRRDPQFVAPQLERNLALVEKLKPVARSAGRSMAELAIAWTLSHPAVTAAIVGLRDPSQTDLLAAADWHLDDDIRQTVEQMLADQPSAR